MRVNHVKTDNIEDQSQEYYTLNDYKLPCLNEEREDVCLNFSFGEITLWKGDICTGKTTLLTQLAKECAKQGEKVFFFNGEQTAENFKNTIYLQSSSLEDLEEVQYKNTRIVDLYVKKEKVEQIDKELGNKICIYNTLKGNDISSILRAMENLVKKENIKIFFLDSLFVIDFKGYKIKSFPMEVSLQILDKLRRFARKFNVHVHVSLCEQELHEIESFDFLAYNIIKIKRIDKQEINRIKKTAKEILGKRIDKDIDKDIRELKNKFVDIKDINTILEFKKTTLRNQKIIGLKYDDVLKTFSEPKL